MQNKVLIISGIHGDEINAVEIVNCFKKNYPHMDIVTEMDCVSNKIDIDFLEMVNTEGIKSGKSGYEIDLNRSYDFVDPLENVKTFIESGEYDLILDVHNSPSCKDLLLFSNSQEELIKSYDRLNVCKLTWEAQKGSLKDIYPEYNIITLEYNLMDQENHNVEDKMGLIYDTIDHFYKMRGSVKETINHHLGVYPTKYIERVYCKTDLTIFVDIQNKIISKWDLKAKEISKMSFDEFFEEHALYIKKDGEEIKIDNFSPVSWERGFVKKDTPVVFISAGDYLGNKEENNE